MVIDQAFQAEIRYPRLVYHPCQLGMRSQDVVPGSGVLIGEDIRVILVIHAADIGAETGFQTDLVEEGLGVVESEAPAGVGGVRGAELSGRTGKLGAEIEDTEGGSSLPDPKIDSLGHRGLVSPRIHGEDHIERTAALLCVDLDHAVTKVSVFGARHSGQDLYGFDILDAETSGAGSRHGTEIAVSSHAYSIYLYRRSEGGVAIGCAAATKRDDIVAGEVRIYGLSSRKQGRDIRGVGKLEMIEGVPSDILGRVDVVLGCLRGNHHFFQGESVEIKFHHKVFDVAGNLEFLSFRNIAKTVDFHLVSGHLDFAEGKGALIGAYSPEIVFIEPDYGSRNRLSSLGVHYLSADFRRAGLLRSHRRAGGQRGSICEGGQRGITCSRGSQVHGRGICAGDQRGSQGGGKSQKKWNDYSLPHITDKLFYFFSFKGQNTDFFCLKELVTDLNSIIIPKILTKYINFDEVPAPNPHFTEYYIPRDSPSDKKEAMPRISCLDKKWGRSFWTSPEIEML